MAERVEAFEFRERNGKYPWDEWDDGSIWRIKRGEDYAATNAAMYSSLRNRARKTGRELRTRRDDNAEAIVFQFIRN